MFKIYIICMISSQNIYKSCHIVIDKIFKRVFKFKYPLQCHKTLLHLKMGKVNQIESHVREYPVLSMVLD